MRISDDIEIINNDCLVSMKDIEDESINLILCDLPYGTTDRHGSKKGGSRLFKWDSIIPLDLLWKEYKRIIKRNGSIVLTADQPFTSQLVLSNIEWFKYEWIWKKNKTTGFLTANYRPMKQTEDILVFSPANASASAKNKMKYNPQGLKTKRVKKKNDAKRLGKVLGNEKFLGENNKLLSGKEYEQKYTNYPAEILEINVEKKTIHPTQKPVRLMEYLIKTYTDEGDLVLDNCMGSGTTIIACHNLSRGIIGIEKDKKYFDNAKKRILDHINKEQFDDNPFFE